MLTVSIMIRPPIAITATIAPVITTTITAITARPDSTRSTAGTAGSTRTARTAPLVAAEQRFVLRPLLRRQHLLRLLDRRLKVAALLAVEVFHALRVRRE